MERFTTKQAAAQSGASLRQLQWWHEQGILVPENQGAGKPSGGRGRWYNAKQIQTARRLALMSRAGIQVRRNSNLLKLDWDYAVLLRQPRVVNGVLYVPVGHTPRSGGKQKQ